MHNAPHAPPLKRDEAIAELRRAAALVKQALARLDARRTRCPHCGLMGRENLLEGKAADALDSARKKLLRWADNLAAGTADDEDDHAGTHNDALQGGAHD
jgi:hypothetical protein